MVNDEQHDEVIINMLVELNTNKLDTLIRIHESLFHYDEVLYEQHQVADEHDEVDEQVVLLM